MADENESKAIAEALAEASPEAVAEANRAFGVGVEWPVTVKLRRPVEFGKETVEALVFQEGTFATLKGLGLGPVGIAPLDALMVIAARLCGRSLKVIESLSPGDVSEVVNLALGFLGRCRGAGS